MWVPITCLSFFTPWVVTPFVLRRMWVPFACLPFLAVLRGYSLYVPKDVSAPCLFTFFYCPDLYLSLHASGWVSITYTLSLAILIYAPPYALQLVSFLIFYSLTFFSYPDLLLPLLSPECECPLLVHSPLLFWLVFLYTLQGVSTYCPVALLYCLKLSPSLYSLGSECCLPTCLLWLF
jgi:hypothetical protein